MAKDEQKPMTRAELLAIIEQARRENWEELDLSGKGITELPPEIGQLKNLKKLNLGKDRDKHDELENKLTQLPDEIGQLTSLQKLNLRYNQLTALPESIGQLTSLQTLDLDFNRLATLPESIGQLTSLQTLILAYNTLAALPESIGQLTKLQELNLCNNELTALPESIGQLTSLETLDLGHNRLTPLLESIGQLTSLQTLNVNDNQLTTLPDSIGQLVNLEGLNIDDNHFIKVPQQISKLTKLRELRVSGNKLTEFPTEIGQLINLEFLAFGHINGGNQLTIIPPTIGKFSKLRNFWFPYNKLAELPQEISQLVNLDYLNLENNQLISLPASLARLKELKELKLDDNPLNPALKSVYDQGLPALMAYLRSLEQAEPLYETKLVLVGEGGVGKTTLLKALTGKEPKQNEPTTHGVSIDIHSMHLPHPEKQGVNIQFNAWDFGGQEVYRVTHQFFFSKRSVYLLVWEPRMGVQQCQVEDWLKLIRLRVGDDAKVIIVSTHAKTGERIARIDKPVFLRDYGSMIVDFIEVDSLEPDPQNKNEKFGIAALKQLIATAAQKLEHMGMDFGKAWKEARDELIELGQTQPHVAYAQFAAVCEKHGLESIGTRTLAGIMHDLGYIVYYGDDERLSNDVVLQPEWLTKAIGFVLEDRKTQEMDGILPDNRLREVLFDHPFKNEPKYPTELYPFFLRLMEKYDVSYRLESGEASLVAQHVPQVRPALPWQPEEEHQPDRRRIAMVCVMEESPPGLVPWMIVRTHDYVYEDRRAEGKPHRLHWQKGVFLRNKSHGEAMLELREREFHVYAEAVWPEYFMNVLRQTLQKLITDNWPGLKDRYYFAVPCREQSDGKLCNGRFNIDSLRQFLEEGDTTIRCQTCRKRQGIVELLYGFEEEDSREQLVRIETKLDRGFDKVRRESGEIESRLANYVMTILQAIASESKDGPRLFNLIATEGNWHAERFRLHLWCEAEGCQHPVLEKGKGVYEFKSTQEWIKNIAPYANFVAGLLKTILPMVTPAVNTFGGEKTIEKLGLRDEINLMKEGTSKLLQDIKISDPSRLRQHVLSEAERSGVLALHAFLREVDLHHEKLGLKRIPTYTGDYLWLCEKHYELSISKIPDKIGQTDVCDVIFLYHPRDDARIKQVVRIMKERKLKINLYEIEFPLNQNDKAEIKGILGSAKTAAFFINNTEGSTKQQSTEILAFLNDFDNSITPIVPIFISSSVEDIELQNTLKHKRYYDFSAGFKKSKLDDWEQFITGIKPELTWIDWLCGQGDEENYKTLKQKETDISIRPILVRLRNIRSFANSEPIKIINDDVTQKPVLLLGNNASGKSTVLQCLALAALGSELANQAGYDPQSFLRHGETKGFIEVVFQIQSKKESELIENTFVVGIEIEKDRNSFEPMTESLSLGQKYNAVSRLNILRRRINDKFGFMCGYGPWRTLINDPKAPWKESNILTIDRVKSLFDPNYILGHPDVIGKMILGDLSNFNSAPDQELDVSIRKRMVTHLKKLMPGVKGVDEGETCTLQLNSIPVSIRGLSDGYRSLMAIIGHLFYHALRWSDWQQDPADIHGTLLIDEIDLHLHPTWQRHVLPNLQSVFPNLQIIAASHSPMIAGSVAGESIIILRHSDTKTMAVKNTESVKGWRADQILTSFLFDLPTSRDVDTEQLFYDYSKKLNEKGPNDPEVLNLGQTVSEALSLEGEGKIDWMTYQLLEELLAKKFADLDEETKKLVLAKAGLLA